MIPRTAGQAQGKTSVPVVARPRRLRARSVIQLSPAILCAALLAPATPVLAQRQVPPAPGAPKDFRLPETRTVALGNGMSVTLVPFGATPKAAIQLVLRAGSADETADQIWLAALTGDLMREGTNTRTAEQIAIEAASMGGSLNVGAGADELTVGGEVLADFAPQMVRLVADVVQNPLWPESELPRLKANRLRSLAIAKSRPQVAASERFLALLFPGHPYGRSFPTEAMLQGYTVEQLRAFHAANFGAARAHLYVVGVFDAGAVEAAVRDAFGAWPAGMPPQRATPSVGTRRAIHIIDRPGAVQSSIYLGLPTIDRTSADWVPLEVTDALLGGAFASRITRNIREDKGYTYSPFSFIGTYYRTGYWAEVADVTTAVTGASLREIFAEIERLRAEPPSTGELHGIQNYLAGTFTLQNASRSGLIGTLRMLGLHGLSRDYLENYVRNVHAVTPASVQRMAQTHLRPDDMVIVIVGDRRAILEQVRPFGPIAP